MKAIPILDMIDTQNNLNELTIPQWQYRLNIDDYTMALASEFDELMGSGRKWAWWKAPKTINEWNEKIEVIDILHFFLSKMILDNSYRNIDGSFGDAMVIYDTPENDTFENLVNTEGHFNNTGMMDVSRLLQSSSSGWDEISGMNWVIKSFGMNGIDVAIIYTMKATLNQIRQERGYSKGEYKARIGGIEDNEFLQSIYNEVIADPDAFDTSDVREKVLSFFAE